MRERVKDGLGGSADGEGRIVMGSCTEGKQRTRSGTKGKSTKIAKYIEHVFGGKTGVEGPKGHCSTVPWRIQNGHTRGVGPLAPKEHICTSNKATRHDATRQDIATHRG